MCINYTEIFPMDSVTIITCVSTEQVEAGLSSPGVLIISCVSILQLPFSSL